VCRRRTSTRAKELARPGNSWPKSRPFHAQKRSTPTQLEPTTNEDRSGYAMRTRWRYQLSQHSEVREATLVYRLIYHKSKLNSRFRRVGVAALRFGPLSDAAVRENVLMYSTWYSCLSATSRASAQQDRNAGRLRALSRRLGSLRTKPGIQKDRGWSPE
jgi:hypothetical protein